ncbi:MAG TPA: plastocyanin/azurin family copper-binding protein [Solirubrobacter sp.]|nr:plastocyanin/azurin family copper-binding protein [Solirubrobacter sp.]
MRLVGLVAAAFVALPVASAAADEAVVHGLDTLTWDVTTVNVKPGDTVRWTFAGTTQFHNVAANSPNWTDESPLGAPAADYTRTFDAEGDYAFICRVHPDTMRGTVHVSAVAPPPPPPPPLSEQPFPNDAVAPVAPETGVAVDRSRPALSGLSARRVARGARVRFKVSEESVVSVAVRRGKRVVKRTSVRASGRRSLTLRGLRAGRYTIQLRATDRAGNRCKLRTLRVTVR